MIALVRPCEMAIGRNEVQCFRTDTGRPTGPSLKVTVGLTAAMEFAADGRSLWVASPGYEKVVDQWTVHRFDPVSGQPIQPPITSSWRPKFLTFSQLVVRRPGW